jgi:type II secretory pathway component GspD/PulD (secretin)
MYPTCAVTQLRNRIPVIMSIALLVGLFARNAAGQTPAPATTPADTKPDQQQLYQTFYVGYATDQNSFNDIQTDLRNMIPRAKVYGVPSQNAICMRGTSDDIAMAQKVIADLDRPRKVYRLTYTITDAGSGQSASARHYTLIVASGDRTVFKQGDRVPIVTARSGDNPSPPSAEVQYLDIGLNIDAALATSADVLMLRSKIEISNVANPASSPGAGDPDIRQTVLQNTSSLVPSKPLVLGSLDVPGTPQHEEIEVLAELVR